MSCNPEIDLRRASTFLCLTLLLGVAPTAEAQLVVSNASAETGIGTFAGNASGNAAPLRRISGPASLVHEPGQLAIDAVHGEILVADFAAQSMKVYPLGANGDTPPSRILNTGDIDSIALDSAHDEVFAVQSFSPSRVSVYARTASGHAAALRTIEGAATQLDIPTAVAVDVLHDEIIVVSQGSSSLQVFGRAVHGNVAPKRVLQGNKTLLGPIYGLTLDNANDEIVVTDRNGALSFFARTASGNTAPLRRIAGPQTMLRETLSVSMLGATDIVATSNASGQNNVDDRVLFFPRTANGDVAPSRTLGGPASHVEGPESTGVVSMVLRGSRFYVEATWRTPNGVRGLATAQKITGDTGYLWFFSDQNVEAVVKVLDGCGTNGRFWVFAGGLTNVFTSLKVTDLATGKVRVYTNPLNRPFEPIQDTSAFATCGTPWNPTSPAAATPARRPPDSVSPLFGCTGLCLLGNRYQVTATWRTASSQGTATGVKLTDDTGYLWFFGPSNVEVVVKVLNGCLTNNRAWVFAGGLTDVEVTLTVHDTFLGKTVTYANALGHAFRPIQDTQAFAVCA